MGNSKAIYAILGPAILLGLGSVTACGDSTGSGGAGAGSSGGGGSGAGTSDDPYVFATESYAEYVQVDRHAAVEAGTVGISATAGLGMAPIRDDYNAGNPEMDATGAWLGQITQSVTDLHGALDDDLTGLKLVPATVEQALAQAGPVIVPDTIKYDPAQPTGYPNGRALEDQVVDITLAAVLLDLGAEGQPLTFFADLPLNPPANDVPFKSEFPFLADPHAG